ncbi:FAD-binding domain-containing protein [Serendipita vermifera]|nr:FAD-binding domain-containing protein [Serendipita vermifera]
MNSLSTFLLLVSNIFTTSWANNNGGNRACTYPQPCWPSQSEWNSLNQTLHGSLVRARPPAYVCHDPDFNEAQCQVAQQNWTSDFWRSQQPGAYHDLVWENGDSYCNIDNNATVPCDQGLVPIYVAQVKSVDHVKTAVKFAKKHKLSTRVKGASHDFLGRSSGNGTFGIQTINLKGIEFDDEFKPAGAPNDLSPQGVVHVASGEHWYYVNKAADEHGVIVVGGASYSVGAAGGWILGGGHSSLSPQYGLGVDNVVQFEIVTPDGELRTANAYKNKDLFWALRGGGPGFGVLTKVTYKTHPAITSFVALSVNVTYPPSAYRELLKSYLVLLPTLSERNLSGYFWPTMPVAEPSSANLTSFATLLFAYNSDDIAAVNSTLTPFYDFLQREADAGRPLNVATQAYVLTSYMQLWPGPVDKVRENAGSNSIQGSRLLPASVFEEGNVDAFVDLVVQTPYFPHFNFVAGGKVQQFAPDSAAVHPSWRKAIMHFLWSAGWETDTPFDIRQQIRQALTQETQKLGALAPEAGAYVNEYNEPNWKETFWGSNYNRLVGIKRSIDPAGIFTCYHCVGYEEN